MNEQCCIYFPDCSLHVPLQAHRQYIQPLMLQIHTALQDKSAATYKKVRIINRKAERPAWELVQACLPVGISTQDIPLPLPFLPPPLLSESLKAAADMHSNGSPKRAEHFLMSKLQGKKALL